MQRQNVIQIVNVYKFASIFRNQMKIVSIMAIQLKFFVLANQCIAEKS